MTRPDLERTAFTVECFLNALRLNDGAERTHVEAILTRWLAGPAHREDEFLVYSNLKIECRSRGKEYNTFEVPQAELDKTVWCNGSQIEIIDGEEFRNNGKLVMLGIAGLDFSLPVAAATTATVENGVGSTEVGGEERSSSETIQ